VLCEEEATMDNTAVDRLHGDFSALLTVLHEKQEISLLSSVDDNWRKALLLSAASHFEYRMTSFIIEFVNDTTGGNSLVTTFVKNKAVSRQFHTWFNWGDANANSFFGLFGSDFRTFMQDKVRRNEELSLSIKAFLELGAERNRLVHQDYGTFPMEKTADEIYGLYKKALMFVVEFPKALSEFSDTQRSINESPISR